MNLRIQAFIFLLLLAHQSFEVSAQALPLVDGNIYAIQNPSGAFLDPLDLPLPWIFFEQSDFLTSFDPKALVQNRNLFEQFPKYLSPQFPGNAQNLSSGVASLVGEALIELATEYVAENVLKRNTTFLQTQNAVWTAAWNSSADKMRQSLQKVNQGQVASLEQDIQNISTNLANSINSSQLTQEENSIIFQLWNSLALEPFKDAARQNKSLIEMFANMTAQINAVPNSIEYQNILQAQFETRNSASARGSASQMFSQVNKYQRELGYKQAYNFYTYLSKKSQLNGPEEVVYSFTVSQDNESLFQITTFNISNLDKNQWTDLVSQLNHTIISYLTNQNTLFLYSPPYIYTYLESDQEIEFILDQSGFFRIKLTNFTEDTRNEFLAQISQTIASTFSVQPDIAQLLTSVSGTLFNAQVSDGIKASFKTIQTEQNFYQVSFDASSSYNLWADSLVCSWDFGDGTGILRGVNLFNTTHVYDKAGNYTVTLKVQDFYGHSIAAKGLSPVIILFNRPPAALLNLGTYYIAGKSEGWMFLDGNSYSPIPFVNGAGQATLFALEKQAAADTWAINARGVNGEIINNYLGVWGLPANSTATLQASFLPPNGVLPAHANFRILPITNESGYWTIQNTAGLYLTITGNFTNTYEPYLCGFTFTSGAQKTQAQLAAKLREAGSQTLSDLGFTNQVNQLKLQTSSGHTLLDFFPNKNTGYYSVADSLQANLLLTSNGQSIATSFNINNSPTDSYLWSVRALSDTSMILTSKQNSQLCLNQNVINNRATVTVSGCPALNNSCYDRVGRFINKPTCQTQQDQYCCDDSLLSKKLYYDSCQTCSSGQYYCPSVANQNNVFIETSNFKSEKCEHERKLDNSTFSWSFNRIDPATTQIAWLNQVTAYKASLLGVRMYNVGFGKFVCQTDNPTLCDQGSLFDIVTFSVNAELNLPSANNVGNMIRGTGALAPYFVSGPYLEDNNQVFSLPDIKYAKGHFWYVNRIGYNTFTMQYVWGFGGVARCMAPVIGDSRATGTYAGKILLQFVTCDSTSRNQQWYFGY